MKTLVLGAALLSLSTATMAADVVGQLRDVKGSVTVSSAAGVVKAVAGTPLAAGSRILVGPGAKATVQLTEGCVIPLKANQYLALNPKLVCTQLVASVTQLAEPHRVAGAPDKFAFRTSVVPPDGLAGGLADGLAGAATAAAAVTTFIAVDQVGSNDISGN